MPDFVAGEIVTANKMNQIPKGVLGYALRTENITNLDNGPIDLPDLSVQVSVPDGRLIRVVGYVRHWGGEMVQGEEANLLIREGDDTLGIKRVIAAKDGVAEGGAVEALLRPSAGIHTYKLSFLQVTASSNEWSVVASAAIPAYILVEDIGADLNA